MTSVNRRGFLKTGASAALVLAWRWPGLALAQAAGLAPAAFSPNAFLSITPDDRITLAVIRMEMGQGVRTLLPAMIAEELEVDLAQVTLEQAMPGGRFKDIELHTSGSGSSTGTYRLLRTAGAAAREMLVGAAADAWGVDASACRAEHGAVLHPPTGRRRTYGQLVSAASTRSVPANPALKDPKDFRLLRHPIRRIDGPDIVTGRAVFGLDVHVPGMQYASIERAPTFGATLVRFDPSGALKVPGVLRVVPVTTGIHPGVAVVAANTWAALRARAALKIEWTAGAEPAFDSASFLQALPEAARAGAFAVRRAGDAGAAVAGAPRRLAASYVYPFQAHAPMEPMNCTAHVREHDAEIWAPTQTAVRSMQQAVKVTGFPEDRITIHSIMMGGGFGRRLFSDTVAEALELSKAIGAPVQVVWSRSDDIRFGYFQPATAEHFEAGLDDSGRLTGLVHHTSASDLTIYDQHGGRALWGGPPKPPKEPNAYAQDESPWGAFDNPYAIANLRVDCADVTSPVPTGPWRAVEYPSTVFGRESFLDELAHAAGRDPIEFRLELLPAGAAQIERIGARDVDRGRLARVLRDVRERAAWTAPLAAADSGARGRGVAASVYHAGSYIAMVAEVTVARDRSRFTVDRLVTVVDPGIALNPLGLEGQTESAITWGLSAALSGKIDFRGGAAIQSGFNDFRVVRQSQMPRVETHIVESGARPGGFGEHVVPLVAPAVANAIFNATGLRLRQLPLQLGQAATAAAAESFPGADAC